jgi:hypothetical protein
VLDNNPPNVDKLSRLWGVIFNILVDQSLPFDRRQTLAGKTPPRYAAPAGLMISAKGYSASGGGRPASRPRDYERRPLARQGALVYNKTWHRVW